MLIDNLYKYGISVHYKVKYMIGWQGQFRRGIFTSGAFDNADIELQSTTAQRSFHGTVITFVPVSHQVESWYLWRTSIEIGSAVESSKYSLLVIYTTVPAVSCKVTDAAVPNVSMTDWNDEMS